MVKPFGMQELLARIRVLLGRFGHRRANIVDTKHLCINLEARLVTVRGKRVNLGPKEFEVLKALVLARVVSPSLTGISFKWFGGET